MNISSLKLKKPIQETTTYVCGSCKNNVKLTPKEQVICKECGYRILYKLRSNRPSEYYAR